MIQNHLLLRLFIQKRHEMICDFTVPTPELKRKTDQLLGKSYSFFERWKIGGIGSHRLLVKEFSEGFKPFIRTKSESIFAVIELRPKGIVVHVSNRHHRISWFLPYYQLSIYQSEGFTLHGNGQFIRFELDSNYTKNKPFFQKMMHYREQQYFSSEVPIG